MVRPSRNENLVITGIPRSGTSLLCKMLNAEPDVAVVNEPEDVFEVFLRPWWRLAHPTPAETARRLVTYYGHLRERIRSAEPIANKTVADTRVTDERQAWVATVEEANDFLLATKNTLLYTCNLAAIRESGIPVVALVRHPCDSIGSWRTSTQANLSHLRDGDLRPARKSSPLVYSDEQKHRLRQIAAEPKGSLERLAACWNFLVGQYLDNADSVSIVRYEALTRAPSDTLAAILGGAARATATQTPLQPRHYETSEEDRSRIWALCSEFARPLGYTSANAEEC